MCSMFAHFHTKKQIWHRIVSCIAELDCLCSLAIFASTCQGGVCKPKFLASEGSPVLELKQMRHPGVTLTFRPGEPAAYQTDEGLKSAAA